LSTLEDCGNTRMFAPKLSRFTATAFSDTTENERMPTITPIPNVMANKPETSCDLRCQSSFKVKAVNLIKINLKMNYLPQPAGPQPGPQPLLTGVFAAETNFAASGIVVD